MYNGISVITVCFIIRSITITITTITIHIMICITIVTRLRYVLPTCRKDIAGPDHVLLPRTSPDRLA